MIAAPVIKAAPASSQPMMTRKSVAAFLGVSVACLEKWAERGTGPKFYRKGFSIHSHTAYRIEDVEQFVQDSMAQALSEV